MGLPRVPLPHADKVRYLVAGSGTTLGIYLLYWLLLLLLDPRVAYAIANVCGVAMSYTAFSLWVFRRKWTQVGLVAYALGTAVQVLVSYGVFLLLLAFTPVPAWAAPVLVTILLLPAMFLWSRALIHRTSPPQP